MLGFSQEEVSNQMHTQIRAIFRIMGEAFDVQKVTEQLGIAPTETWRKGDWIRKTGKRRTYTAWIYDTGPFESLDMGEAIHSIREIFFPKTDELVSLKEEDSLEISLDFVIEIAQEQPPAIYFDSDFIQFAAKIGARFDVDTYLY